MTVSAISAAVPRRRTTVVGRVTTTAARVRPWVCFEVEVADDTGALLLRFLGRTEIPGMLPGRLVQVEGTPSCEHDTLMILNPVYSFVADCAP